MTEPDDLCQWCRADKHNWCLASFASNLCGCFDRDHDDQPAPQILLKIETVDVESEVL
jgi:hypothetical protein